MKQFSFTILFMALTIAMQAQDLHFGITAGPTLGTMKSDYDTDQSGKYVLGFHIGAFAELPLADKFSLRPELKYQTSGVKYPPDENDETFGLRTKSSYIMLPVMLEYALTEKLKVGVGPYMSMMLSLKDKMLPYAGAEDYFGGDMFDFDYVDESMHFKKLDLGIGAGLSYQVVPKIGVNIRYSLGLSNTLKDADDDSKIRNRFFTLGVSYSIR